MNRRKKHSNPFIKAISLFFHAIDEGFVKFLSKVDEKMITPIEQKVKTRSPDIKRLLGIHFKKHIRKYVLAAVILIFLAFCENILAFFSYLFGIFDRPREIASTRLSDLTIANILELFLYGLFAAFLFGVGKFIYSVITDKQENSSEE